MKNKSLRQNNRTVFVYVAAFDKSVVVREVEPALRNESIQQCKDPLTKQQRYCVWRLLDYALKQRYGKGVKDYNFTVTNGKWACDEVYFSLTHCDNVVAVAVGSDNVGIDVEAVEHFSRHVDDSKFVERVLTADEMGKYINLPPEQKAQALAILWTRKESLFKLDGSGAFSPNSIETNLGNEQSLSSLTRPAPLAQRSLMSCCGTVLIGEKEYALAVATGENYENFCNLAKIPVIFVDNTCFLCYNK